MSHDLNAFQTNQPKSQVTTRNPRSQYTLEESEVADLFLAETRIEALRSLALVFLREIEAIKKILNPKRSRKTDGPIDLEKEMVAIEIGIIKWALIKTGGNQAAAAKLLSINATTLHGKMKRHGIRADDRFLAVD